MRLRAANPFDLIRLIARSQSEPRKAIAELVQNSLDAAARHVWLTWFTHKRARALSILDDGEGIFPGDPREEALRRLATTIGHSYKAGLAPAERHQQMTLGKYGIGLLGFWSVARVMEIRSRVGGGPTWVLRLEEDCRDATVQPSRAQKLPLEGTFTEIVLKHVHPGAVEQVKPRRLAPYLGQELRGQLLERHVDLEILDRVARGRAQKRRVVRPVRFSGARIEGLSELPIPGYRSARLELYLVPERGGRTGRVAIACVGAAVLDDLAEVRVSAAPTPWATGRLEGVIDVPDLSVAPATRRGFVPDAAASAFLDALAPLEERLVGILEKDAEQRRREEEADDARHLRRLFRSIPRLLPDYALFGVDGAGDSQPARTASGTALASRPADAPAEFAGAVAEPDPEGDGAGLLYEPGPLATVDLRPRKSRLAPGGSRDLRAVARDADGRPILANVSYQWALAGEGDLEGEGATARYAAPDFPCSAVVAVRATQGDTEVVCEARVLVTDDQSHPQSAAGIPDPAPVEAPAESWRSRMLAGRWQYNSGHRDYRAVRDDRKRRLRYLAQLFAKELVLLNYADSTHEPALERMVQVLTYVAEPAPRSRRPRRA